MNMGGIREWYTLRCNIKERIWSYVDRRKRMWSGVFVIHTQMGTELKDHVWFQLGDPGPGDDT